MIFRSHLWELEKKKPVVERDHRQISRMAGEHWNHLSEAERTPFRLRAVEEKRQHALRYPDYRYAPGGRKQTQRTMPHSSRCKRRRNQTAVAPPTSRRRRGHKKANNSARSLPAAENATVASSSSQSPPRTLPEPGTLSPHSDHVLAGASRDESPSPIERHSPSLDIVSSMSPNPSSHEEYVPTSEIPPLCLDGEDIEVSSQVLQICRKT